MSPVHIAWFSPFPPVRTGVSAVSAELVAGLGAQGHRIDPYPETRAHDFPWMHRQRPYDLIVYHFGNSSHHDYEWPYALRYPGLVVLHDTRLHHARAALLLREKRRDDYRRELRGNHPALNPDVAELAIAGFDSRLYYDWPMCRALVERSCRVAVHGEATRLELIEALTDDRSPRSEVRGPRSEVPDPVADKVVAIRLGHGERVSAAREAAARDMLRGRYGIPQDAIVFGLFGGLTPEKRLPQILEAFRAVQAYAPGARLLLGGADAPHFPLDAFRASDGVTITGYIDDRELTDHIAAVDVSLNLRWPTARETSGPWLRALAAGKATVITDLAHLTGFASLDPRTWRVNTPSASEAITVAIDILDEDHSLRIAMRRLATDAGLRAQLGQAAREHWQREHSLDAMMHDYGRVMREAREKAGDAAGSLAHLRSGGGEALRTLLEPFGIESPLS